MEPNVPHEDKHASKLLEAIRVELKGLVEDPDLATKLSSIALVATRAQELVLSLRADPAAIRNSSGGPIAMSINNVATALSGVPVMPSLSPSYVPPEQFGATAIRQLVALLPDILAARQRDPVSLVEAIAKAREKGMNELAGKLERQLTISLPEPDSKEHDHEEGISADAPPPPLPAAPAPQLNGAAAS